MDTLGTDDTSPLSNDELNAEIAVARRLRPL
jgi:hypothetical protein